MMLQVALKKKAVVDAVVADGDDYVDAVVVVGGDYYSC